MLLILINTKKLLLSSCAPLNSNRRRAFDSFARFALKIGELLYFHNANARFNAIDYLAMA